MRHEGVEDPGPTALAILNQAAALGTGVVPAGAGNRRSGDDGDRDKVQWLSTNFQAVRRWAAADFTVEADAGLSVPALNRTLADRGQWLPVGMPDGAPDTLGGIVSAGLSGVWTGGYGPASDRILAMTVATPAFGVVRLGAPVVKNVAGYNLWRLYWATRGTFGIILTVTWKLAPVPRATAAIECAGTGPRMGPALAEARRWRAAANAWAALLLGIDGSEWRLKGVVHGGDAAVARVQRELGGGLELRHDLGIQGAYGERVEWQARLPSAQVAFVLDTLAEAGQKVLAELESGMVWGLGAARGPMPLDEVAALFERHGGAFRRLAGPWRAPKPPPADGAVWRRIKAAVDPAGVLPALDGGAEA